MTLRRTIFVGAASAVTFATSAQAAGLPQLDHRWYPNELFWLVISFGLLFFVVSKFVAPNIHGVLKTRENAIDEAIREAERAKHTAESTKSGAELANLEARNKASAFLAKAQADVSANAHEATTKLDHDLARKMKQAEVRIEESKAKALHAINSATVSLASAMASKLLGHAVDEEQTQQIVLGLANAQGGK